MQLEEVERARLAPLGIPGHLLRSAARDGLEWLRFVFTGDWDHAFLAELRLRFFKGFVWTRLAR